MWGEKIGTFTNADRTVHLSEKAVNPPGEARPDFEKWLAGAEAKPFEAAPVGQAELSLLLAGSEGPYRGTAQDEKSRPNRLAIQQHPENRKKIGMTLHLIDHDQPS